MNTTEMKSFIMKKISNSPSGMRKRDLFSPADTIGHRAIEELVNEGSIMEERVTDVGNMESYILYKKCSSVGFLIFDKEDAWRVEYTSNPSKAHFYRDDEETTVIPVNSLDEIFAIFEKRGLDPEFYYNFVEIDIDHEDYYALEANNK